MVGCYALSAIGLGSLWTGEPSIFGAVPKNPKNMELRREISEYTAACEPSHDYCSSQKRSVARQLLDVSPKLCVLVLGTTATCSQLCN